MYYDFNEGHAFIAERKSAGSEWKIRDIVYPDNLVVATRIFGTNAAGDLVGATIMIKALGWDSWLSVFVKGCEIKWFLYVSDIYIR